MTSRSTAAEAGPVGQSTSPGLSGWCIANQHAECAYLACTCQVCPPEVHHSRMNERVLAPYGQMPERALDDDAEVSLPAAA